MLFLKEPAVAMNYQQLIGGSFVLCIDEMYKSMHDSLQKIALVDIQWRIQDFVEGGPKEIFDFHRNTIVGVMVGTKRGEGFPGAERG